jgi:hypothetical protein
MYIALANRRGNGFVKWGDACEPEKLGGARSTADEGGTVPVRAAPTSAEQAHRPWLVPGAGRL